MKSRAVIFSTGLAMFSMFFGSGNLVFPLLVGQMSEGHYLLAGLGIVLTGVFVPFLGILAMLFFQGKTEDLFSLLGRYAPFCLSLLCLSIMGPFGVLARCITVAHGAFQLLIPHTPLWAFSLVSCGAMFLLTLKQNRIVPMLGSILTPFLLASLAAIAAVGPAAAVTGTLAAPLAASPALMFEAGAALEIDCDTPSAAFASSEGAAFAAGANRLLVGEEVLQFMRAEVLAGSRWRLSGLLRGRGGTEGQARAGHLAGARAVLLDERLALFDAAVLDPARERLAAIGAGEAEPVLAAVATPGRSRQPPAPVHPVALAQGDGGLRLEWTRRARGGWRWPDGVEVALVEESEAYEVGAGPLDAPLASWRCPGPALVLPASALAALGPGTALWVRQIGSHAKSAALLLYTII